MNFQKKKKGEGEDRKVFTYLLLKIMLKKKRLDVILITLDQFPRPKLKSS